MKIYKYLGAFIFVLTIKTWLLKPYIVVSESMKPNLKKGDYLLMNSWQESFFGKNKKIYNNDIIFFYYPLDEGVMKKKITYLKRCIGIPGDTITINSNNINTTLNLFYDYLIKYPDSLFDENIFYDFENRIKISKNELIITASRNEIKQIQKINSAIIIKKIHQNKNEYDATIFPSDSLFLWNKDYYGPIYIPKSGDSIELNIENIALYKRIIEKYEGHIITKDKSGYKIDSKKSTKYVFEEDYYFVVGDNRQHSFDSRNWGFVPKNHIISSVAIKLFNIKDFSFQDCFKKIL